MAEPIIPVGFSIAWIVLNLVGWYGGWRRGLEIIHQDIGAHRTAERDIRMCLGLLSSQMGQAEAWRKSWWIPDAEGRPIETEEEEKSKKKRQKELPIREPKPKGPPDEFFEQLWGREIFEKILRILRDIYSLFEEKKKSLMPYMGLEKDGWNQLSKTRRLWLRGRFVFLDRGTTPNLGVIEQFAHYMKLVQDEADRGWKRQRREIIRSFELSESEVGRLQRLHPYHVLMASCLAKIASGTTGGRDDAEENRMCSQHEAVRRGLIIIIDTDVFKTAAFAPEGQDLNCALEYINYVDGRENTRWKVDLLLRDINKHHEQLVRVELERSVEEAELEPMISGAFAKFVANSPGPVNNAYFRSDGPAARTFGLTIVRDGDSSRVQSTILEKFNEKVSNGLFTATELAFSPGTARSNGLLPEISNYRAAFELAQATLLFLGTSWFGDVCRSNVQILSGPRSTYSRFGLEMTGRIHDPRPCMDTDGQREVRGVQEVLRCDRSWCSTNYGWDDMNKAPRRLGLLLIELALGTVIMPSLTGGAPGAREVGNISVLVREGDMYKWMVLTRDRVLSIAKRRSFHDEDDFQHAIEYCLTEKFPQSPNDREREFHFKKFYFRVVKPLRDMYARVLNEGQNPEYYLEPGART
ncbi:hypothetical protein F4825DRAFT_453149 [Nemania diffusa]|nr:hypothetical protein F4825DRAFT_453149 [Nemania diffusa]